MLGFQQLGPPRGTPVIPKLHSQRSQGYLATSFLMIRGAKVCAHGSSLPLPPLIPFLFYIYRGCFPPPSSFFLLCPAWCQFCFPNCALVSKSSSLRWNCFSPGLILYHSPFLHPSWQKHISIMALIHSILPQRLCVSSLQTQSPAPLEGELRPFEPSRRNLKTCRKECTQFQERGFPKGGWRGSGWRVVRCIFNFNFYFFYIFKNLYLIFKEMKQIYQLWKWSCIIVFVFLYIWNII